MEESLTPTLGMTKPAQTDAYDVGVFNGNADIIDAESQRIRTKDTQQDAAIETKANKALDNVTGILPIAHGGTGANNATQARANLGIGPGQNPTFSGIEVKYVDFHLNPTQPTQDYETRLILNETTNNLCVISKTGTATLEVIGNIIARNLTVNGMPFRPIYIQSSFPQGATEGSILIHQ